MSDDTTRGGEGDDGQEVDPSIRDRRQAQGAAGDLARMGIDPRSLGLGEPEAPPRRPASEPDEDDGEPRAPVVFLRPELEDRSAPPVAPPVADPVDPVRPPTEVERLLARQGQPQSEPRQASRLLRSVARGLVTPDGAVAVQGERQVVDAVRQRQTDRRIIAFISGKGGVGCTTIAVGAGTTFMAMRDDRSVVVDVQQGSPSIGRIFGAAEPRSVASLMSELEAVTPPVSASGLGLVDGSGWDQGLSRSDLAGVLDRLRADHTFNLLDVGDDAGEAGHAALARADQAVIVTGPGGLGLSALGSALDRLRLVNPQAGASAVHVVVCPHEQSHRDAHRATVEALGVAASSVVVVPPDPYLQAGHAYDPAHVLPSTREAMLRIAGAIATRGAR